MKLREVSAMLIVGAVMSGCAKQPENIAAIEMGTDTYQRMSCRTLSTEEAKITAELSSLSAAQKSAASSDTIGVLLLGLPLSSMSGNDKEASIAVAKGRMNAINTVQASKGCAAT